MKFDHPLISGILIKRYKRFLADIRLDSGDIITAHCPNTGAMQGVLDPGNKVLLSYSSNPSRKYPHTWEMVQVGKTWVGINTHNPNKVVQAALEHQLIPDFSLYSTIQPEVKYGLNNSRIDFLLTDEMGKECYVEVKNVHYRTDNSAGHRTAVFPSSPTVRGIKHLKELIHVVEQGHQAFVVYCVQRTDCTHFRFGEEIDPLYAQTARLALQKGVNMIAYSCEMLSTGIHLDRLLTMR